MIRAVFYRKSPRLTLQGHAGSAAMGQDLVCAACSALAYTLAANVGNLEALGKVRSVRVKLEPGDAEIGCTPAGRHESTVGLIFQAVCVGFALLAAENPGYVEFEVQE